MKPFFRRMEERKAKIKASKNIAIQHARELEEISSRIEANYRRMGGVTPYYLASPGIQIEEKRKTFLNYFFNRT